MGNLGELRWHFLTFVFLALLARSASGVCYNIYGDVEKSLEYQPCGSGDVTMCCGTNRTASTSTNTQDICLKNGMCLNSMNYGHSYWRISCTSKDWNSGSCLSYCMDQKQNDDTGHAQMTPCDNTSASDYWCCGTTRDCCDTPRAIKIPQTLGESTSSSASTSPTSTPATARTTSPSPHAASEAQGISTGAKAGIGVGVGAAGVIGIGGLLFLYLRRRRNKPQRGTAPRELDAQVAQQPHDTPAQAVTRRHELPAKENEKYELPS